MQEKKDNTHTHTHTHTHGMLTQITSKAQVFGILLSTHCQTQPTTFNKGRHSNWSDTLIVLLFAPQLQYGSVHYHGHYPVVTKQHYLHSIWAQLLISQGISSFFPSLSSHFLSKRATASSWNFIVYVFIHCEAGITDFTRSFKQMSEYSIDWNVNTGWYWAAVTQLQSTSSCLHCPSLSARGAIVFSLNCWLRCSRLHQGLGILGNGTAENEMLILIVQSETEGTLQFILN